MLLYASFKVITNISMSYSYVKCVVQFNIASVEPTEPDCLS